MKPESVAALSIPAASERQFFSRALNRAPPPNQTELAKSLRINNFWRRQNREWFGNWFCTGGEYERLLNRLGEQRPVISRGRRTPVWVKESSTLLLDGEVIKQIRRPNQARNQIRILDAFQEESWPDRIDDPLPRPATGDDSRQLGEAVRSLKQGLQRITFRRDGSGEGVCWEFAPGDPTAK